LQEDRPRVDETRRDRGQEQLFRIRRRRGLIRLARAGDRDRHAGVGQMDRARSGAVPLPVRGGVENLPGLRFPGGRRGGGRRRAAAGVTVWGLPREKDVGWSLPSVTDAAGRFRLTLVAPGEYGFLVSWKGITVVTPRKDDPSRVLVSLSPRENRTGIELVFRR